MMFEEGMQAEEIFRPVINKSTAAIEKDLNKIHANALELPKIKINSKEGKQAKKYYNALRAYEEYNSANPLASFSSQSSSS